MRKQGTVFRWDPAKGFGFIRSPDTDQDIFFHVRDYRGHAAPGEGEPVWFEEIHVGGKGRWRMKESNLHLLSLFGGWPFAWFAQQTLRHKSRKAQFRMAYWVTVAAHFAGLLGWLLWPQLHLLLNK